MTCDMAIKNVFFFLIFGKGKNDWTVKSYKGKMMIDMDLKKSRRMKSVDDVCRTDGIGCWNTTGEWNVGEVGYVKSG